MHWIYILQGCNGQIYVGETTRLFRRFWEHEAGEGGINTKIMGVEKVLAIYKVVDLGRFLGYHQSVIDPEIEYRRCVFSDTFEDDDKSYVAKDIENAITEHLMISRGDAWESVRGGKHVRFVIKYEKPTISQFNSLPFCKCGLPCDVKISEKNDGYFYFRCPSKNLWPEVREQFDLNDVEPCKFFQIYDLDAAKILEFKEKCKDMGRNLSSLLAKNPWLEQLPTFDDKGHCLYCKSKTRKMILYPYKEEIMRALCLQCFTRHSEVLETKLLTPSAPKAKPYKKGPQMFKAKKK